MPIIISRRVRRFLLFSETSFNEYVSRAEFIRGRRRGKEFALRFNKPGKRQSCHGRGADLFEICFQLHGFHAKKREANIKAGKARVREGVLGINSAYLSRQQKICLVEEVANREIVWRQGG